jgi:mono/diheme cytochrome c family protein
MSILLLKSVLAVVLLAAAVTALLAMLGFMGGREGMAGRPGLKRLHQAAGLVVVLLLIVISILCIRYVARAGDEVSLRAVFHGVAALALIGVLAVKLSIVGWFRGLLRLVPALGATAFVLAFVVVATSAGYFFIRSGVPAAGVVMGEMATGEAPVAAGDEFDIERGEMVFEANCSTCHSVVDDERGYAPGLKGVLKKDTLPESGRPATVENVISQLRRPVGIMPSFNSLSNQDVDYLIAYLKTL